MVVAELSIFPMDKGESVSQYVARCVAVIEQSGLAYHFGPMGTSVEGELDQVLDLIRQCFAELSDDCHRIYCTVKLDYREGSASRIDQKVVSVEQKLGHKTK